MPSLARTGGPARYYDVAGLGLRLGLITPLTRISAAAATASGWPRPARVYGCLGQDQKVELRDLLRAGGADAVDAALDRLIAGKPKGHRFPDRRAAARPSRAI